MLESGALISGTHETRILVRVFLDELDQLSPSAAGAIRRHYYPLVGIDNDYRADEERDYYVRAYPSATADGIDNVIADETSYLLQELFDAFDSIAAQHGMMFGGAEGDGACFGFWIVDSDD